MASPSTGNNRIDAGSGDDTIFVSQGDRAFGGDGNDRFFVTTGGGNLLSGGAGADQFWIFGVEAPSSSNTVLGFQVGTDVIGLVGTGITFAQLSLVGNTISLNGTTLAILTGVDTNSLTASNFQFS